MARIKQRKERGKIHTGCWYYETADGDRIYYCSYRKSGKNVTAKYGAKSKGYSLKQCSLYRAKLMMGKEKTRAVKRAELEAAEAMRIEVLYQRYLDDRNNRGRNDSLFRKWVKSYWHGKDISQCTNIDAANYRVWLEAQTSDRGTPLSPQSVKHAIAMFRRIVFHAKKHIKGFVLLIDNYDIPVVHNEKTEDLTPNQLQSLINVLCADVIQVKRKDGKTYPQEINRAVADMMLLMLNTGMRRGEVLKLQHQHVNFERGTILLKDPKGIQDVTILMSLGARAVLKRQKKTSMYVFPGLNGGKRLHIDKQARIIRDLAGLPKDFRPCHGLRHFYGTELHANGANIKVISELLGHKSIEITRRYVKARDEQKREAVESICIGV